MDGYTAGFVHYDDAVLLPDNLDGQIRYGRFVAMNVVGDNITVLDDVALRNCLVIDFDPAVLNGSLLSSVNICPRNQLVSWIKSEPTAEKLELSRSSCRSLHKRYCPDPETLC